MKTKRLKSIFDNIMSKETPAEELNPGNKALGLMEDPEPVAGSESEAGKLKESTLGFMDKWYRNPITQDKLVNTLPKRFTKENVSGEIDDKLKEIKQFKYSISSDLPGKISGTFDNNEGVKINKKLFNGGDERFDNPATTALHETIHSTSLDNKYAELAPKMKLGTLPKHEVYPRLMELRKALNLNPGDEITEEQIQGLGFEGMMEGAKMNPSFLQDLLNEYDVKDIIEMNKKWASNKSGNSFKINNRVPVQNINFV